MCIIINEVTFYKQVGAVLCTLPYFTYIQEYANNSSLYVSQVAGNILCQ